MQNEKSDWYILIYHQFSFCFIAFPCKQIPEKMSIDISQDLWYNNQGKKKTTEEVGIFSGVNRTRCASISRLHTFKLMAQLKSHETPLSNGICPANALTVW